MSVHGGGFHSVTLHMPPAALFYYFTIEQRRGKHSALHLNPLH